MTFSKMYIYWGFKVTGCVIVWKKKTETNNHHRLFYVKFDTDWKYINNSAIKMTDFL